MLTKLTSLSLTIVKVPGDEPMHVGASRIALSNPRLHTFTITYLPPSPSTNFPSPPSLTLDPFHPFGQASFGSLDSKFYGTIEPLEIGHYELISDPHGIPMSLLCWERKRRTYLPTLSSIASIGSVLSLSLSLVSATRIAAQTNPQIKEYAVHSKATTVRQTTITERGRQKSQEEGFVGGLVGKIA